MKKMTIELLPLTLLCFFLLSGDAFAYFDPGVGSMIFQGIAAGLLVLGGFWRQIKNAIVKIFRKENLDEQ